MDKLVAYKLSKNVTVPVVAVSVTVLTKSLSAPTAPWKVAPAELVKVTMPILVPIAPLTSTAPLL